MFSLFEDFDGWLIACFQYLVRQVELLTPLTRDSLFRVLMTLAFAGITSFGFFVMVKLAFFWSFTVLFLLWIGVHYFPVWKTSLRSSHLYPREVYIRISIRFQYICSFILFALLLALVPPEDGFIPLEMMLFCGTYALFYCVEYLLCTTSLPPGEKAKWKCGKELRNAVPTTA